MRAPVGLGPRPALGCGVIGSPTGSGPVSLGSSPGTPAAPPPTAPSSSGLGHRPLKAATAVRIRSGLLEWTGCEPRLSICACWDPEERPDGVAVLHPDLGDEGPQQRLLCCHAAADHSLADAGAEDRQRRRATHGPPDPFPWRSPRPGSKTTEATRARWRTCCAPTCCRRPGSPPPVRDQRGLLRHRAALVGTWDRAEARHPRRARRLRRPRPAATVEPGRRGMAGAAGPAGHSAQDHRRLLGADRPGPPRHRSPGARPARPRQPRPRVQALLALPGIGRITATTLVAELGDSGRFPSAARCAPGRAHPRCATATAPPPRPPHQARLGSGPLRAYGGRRARQDPPALCGLLRQCAARRGRHIATVAVARKLLARCFHVLPQLDNHQHTYAADHASERVPSPAAHEVPHVPATRPLT